jgi:hypothetical protein
MGGDVKGTHPHCRQGRGDEVDAMDKARPAAQKALAQVKRGLDRGQAKLQELAERRRHDQLLRDLGEAYYAEQRGEGDHDAVARAIAALDAHRASLGAPAEVAEAAPPEAVTADTAPAETESDSPPPVAGPEPGTEAAPPGTEEEPDSPKS